jgi:hypothetical protein
MQLYEAFTNCSTHLGNLSVAIGSAALCSKIVSCMMDQKVFAVKSFYSSGGSCVAVERQYC